MEYKAHMQHPCDYTAVPLERDDERNWMLRGHFHEDSTKTALQNDWIMYSRQKHIWLILIHQTVPQWEEGNDVTAIQQSQKAGLGIEHDMTNQNASLLTVHKQTWPRKVAQAH